MLFVDTKGPDNYLSITNYLLSILPEESIFVSFDHGWAVRRLSHIIKLKNDKKIKNIGIFHLNHEQPWLVNVPNKFHNDYANETSLYDLYNQYNDSLIFRNYAHPALDGVSVQLPVGPSFYDYWINNPLSGLNGNVPASERRIDCRFIGRKQYTMTKEESNAGIKERDALFDLACDGNAEYYQDLNVTLEEYSAMEYDELMQFTSTLGLYQSHNRPTSKPDALSVTDGEAHVDLHYPCQVFTYPPGNPVHYEFYMKVMATTRFVPCPPGNNPETFRHYEVCMGLLGLCVGLHYTHYTNYNNQYHLYLFLYLYFYPSFYFTVQTLETGGIPLILKSPAHSEYLSSIRKYSTVLDIR